jgi:hypothetical protein
LKYIIGSGIRVYFENKKDFRNIVFFPDGSYTYYSTGGMLFELIRDDAIYLVTTKAENMIRAFPGFNAEASVESVTDGFRWLCGAVDDEDLPVASELFRSCFSGIVHDVAARPGDYGGVGEFFLRCYAEYLPHIQAFAAYTDAIAAHNSGVADEFQEELAQEFLASADDLKNKAYGFSSSKARQAYGTPYAYETGLFEYQNHTSPYWTRSQSISYKYATRCTKVDGDLGYIRCVVMNEGCRPAVRLSTDDLEISCGSGTMEDPYTFAR